MEKLTATTGILLLCLSILAYTQYMASREYAGSSVPQQATVAPISFNPIAQLNNHINKAFAPIDLSNTNSTNNLLANSISKTELTKNIDSVNKVVQSLRQDSTLTCVNLADAKALQASLAIINNQLKKFNIKYLTSNNKIYFTASQIQALQQKLEDLQPTLLHKFELLHNQIDELLKAKLNDCKLPFAAKKSADS